MKEIELALTQAPLFASLPSSELAHLAATLRTVEVQPDALLFLEGERGDSFYLVVGGQVQVIKALGTAEERVVGLRGPGEFIGEMSLLNREGLRTASVRAVTDVRALEMTRDNFDALLHRRPMLAYEMVRVLSRRLQNSHDAAIRDMQDKNRQLTQAYEELKAAQAQIVEKEKLERELQVAHKIQMSLLPRHLPQWAGFDFGASIAPMTAVGGDFFDFIALDENRLGIAVGDVSGHGVPAALFMALTVTLLRAEACRDCSPGEALRSVNRQILRFNDEGMFVTILYGVLDLAAQRFTYVRAGHEPIVLCDKLGQVVYLPLPRGQILGLFDDLTLEEQTVAVSPGNTLLLYTDGVVEARDPHNNMFGEETLLAAVCATQSSQQSAQAICDQMLKEVSAFSSGLAPSDDITLVCVKAM